MTRKAPDSTRSVRSRDGTTIAFECVGQGPPLVLVDGALCSRSSGPMPGLAPLLAGQCTVYLYDRRGRGGSTDTPPYAVEREIEDIEALIREAGGSAFVYGMSSGAALALEAAARGAGITRLALYEPPFIVDDSRPPLPADYLDQLHRLLAHGRRGDVVRLFLKTVGVPAIFVFLMRFTPAWGKLEALAHTVPYDITILAGKQSGKPLPAGQWDSVTVPTLVLDGGKSPVWMRRGAQALAALLPSARYHTLEGQTHMVSPGVLAPALTAFFAEPGNGHG